MALGLFGLALRNLCLLSRGFGLSTGLLRSLPLCGFFRFTALSLDLLPGLFCRFPCGLLLRCLPRGFGLSPGLLGCRTLRGLRLTTCDLGFLPRHSRLSPGGLGDASRLVCGFALRKLVSFAPCRFGLPPRLLGRCSLGCGCGALGELGLDLGLFDGLPLCLLFGGASSGVFLKSDALGRFMSGGLLHGAPNGLCAQPGLLFGFTFCRLYSEARDLGFAANRHRVLSRCVGQLAGLLRRFPLRYLLGLAPGDLGTAAGNFSGLASLGLFGPGCCTVLCCLSCLSCGVRFSLSSFCFSASPGRSQAFSLVLLGASGRVYLLLCRLSGLESSLFLGQALRDICLLAGLLGGLARRGLRLPSG